MAMKSLVGVALALAMIWGRCQGLGINMETADEEEARLQEENRLIILANGAFNTGGGTGLNLSQLLPLLALAAGTILPLLCLCALAVVLLYHKVDKGGDSYGYGHSSYGTSYRSALGLDNMDWERLSIIDWVSMGEETFRKFDPTNMSCQTRLICELHQNAKQFGKFGKSFVQVFGYLKYLEVFSLPDIIKDLLFELMDAADRGRSLKKDCGDIYSSCDFSIKGLYDRYSINEIQ